MSDDLRLLTLLGEEARVVLRLVMRLRTLELHLASGESRFLAQLTDEIDSLSGTLAELEIARSVAAVGLAEQLGIEPEHASLGRLVAALDEQEAGALATAGARLREVVEEADELRHRVAGAAGDAAVWLRGRTRELELTGVGYAPPSPWRSARSVAAAR